MEDFMQIGILMDDEEEEVGGGGELVTDISDGKTSDYRGWSFSLPIGQ
jgi:hypothetical protein